MPRPELPTQDWADGSVPVAGTPTPTIPTRVRPTARPAAALQPDDQLDQYRIVKPLGEGGMGVVYKAWDVNLRRSVALKVLRPEVATDSTARSRFVREARTAAAVQHDNVVTIHQVGEAGGVPFIAMQYLSGTSLDRYLANRGRGTPLDPAQALRIGREVAAGLAAAHALGLVHRDVKPSNVWLEAPKGRVKLLDFGIAKLNNPTADHRGLTEPGMVMGTPAYMSPEQARGHVTDARSDLFSLGAVLYELLTGVVPFARETAMETLTALAEETPPAVATLNPAAPAAASDLVGRLLAKDPAARPQSADEVGVALRRIERDLAARRSAAAADPGYEVVETEVMPTTSDADFEVVADAAERRPRRNRRRPGKQKSLGLLALAAAGGAALAAVLAVGLVLGLNREGPKPDDGTGVKAAPGPGEFEKQWEAARPDWLPPGSPPPPWWEPGIPMPATPPPEWRKVGDPLPPPPGTKGKRPPPPRGGHQPPPGGPQPPPG